MKPLTVYKLKEWVGFILFSLLVFGLIHFTWTIVCFMIDVPRGY